MLDTELSIDSQLSSGLIGGPPDENFFSYSDPGSGSAILNKNGDILNTSGGISPEAMSEEALITANHSTESVLSADSDHRDNRVVTTNALDKLSSVDTSADELSELVPEDADKGFDANCYAAMNPDLEKADITTTEQLYELLSSVQPGFSRSRFNK